MAASFALGCGFAVWATVPNDTVEGLRHSGGRFVSVLWLGLKPFALGMCMAVLNSDSSEGLVLAASFGLGQRRV